MTAARRRKCDPLSLGGNCYRLPTASRKQMGEVKGGDSRLDVTAHWGRPDHVPLQPPQGQTGTANAVFGLERSTPKPRKNTGYAHTPAGSRRWMGRPGTVSALRVHARCHTGEAGRRSIISSPGHAQVGARGGAAIAVN